MAKFNEYPSKTTPAAKDTFLMHSQEDNAERQIDYEKLADAILNKLTSKTFTLDQGTMTLLSALNQLNSKTEMSEYYGNDLLIYAESLTTGRYFVNTTDKTKNSPCNYGFCIIYIVDKDRKIIIYDKTTNSMYTNTKMDSGTTWIGWRKI